MDPKSTLRLLESYADAWAFPMPSPLSLTPVRQWFWTIAYRASHDSDPTRQFAYVERNAALPWAFNFVSNDSSIDMLPLWAAYPTISAFDINWRMGPGEVYKLQWHEWLGRLSPNELANYKLKYQPPDDDRGWALWFWDVDYEEESVR